jgi:hypothetical protein
MPSPVPDHRTESQRRPIRKGFFSSLLIRRVPEVVPGYPDRILPIDEAAAAILKKRTLTNLYNQRPAWLDHAHAELDRAVASAYGWAADWPMDQDEILARLFQLNQARSDSAPQSRTAAAARPSV